MHEPVISIISELKATSGKNDKIAILESHKDNLNLIDVLVAALSPYIHFYTKKLPDPQVDTPQLYEEDYVAYVLGTIGPHSSRPDIAIALQDIANNIGEDRSLRDFWESVIQKDLGCGIAATSVNKVWKGLIPQFKPMKGEEASHLKKMKLPVWVQDKMDGSRCIVIYDQGQVSIMSSSGRVYPNLDTLKGEINYEAHRRAWPQTFALDGELVFTDEEGDILKREISNGKANKALNGNLSGEEENHAKLYLFDMMADVALSAGDTRPYRERYSILKQGIVDGDASGMLVILPYIECTTWDEVDSLFKEACAAGKEGIMVKDPDGVYEPKRSKAWTKLKAIFDADVEIVGWVEHTKKAGQVGSLDIQTSDGEIQGGVGSGLTDAGRKELFELAKNDDLIGRIVTIQYHALTYRGGTTSFYLPRIVELRNDKVEADTSSKIFNAHNTSI